MRYDILAIVILFSCIHQVGFSADINVSKYVTTTGKFKHLEPIIQSPTKYTSDSNPIWVSKEIFHSDSTEYLRIHLSFEDSKLGSNWKIFLNKGENSEIIITNKDVVNSKEIWSKRIYSSSVIVEVCANDYLSAPSFSIDKYIYQITPKSPKSIIGSETPDWEEFSDVFGIAPIKFNGDFVANLSFVNEDDDEVSCSGFLITNNLFITNYHCINSNKICHSAKATFNYLNISTIPQKDFFCKKFLAGNKILDYALIRLKGNPSKNFNEKIVFGEIKDKKSLYIIHHPDGDPKKISQINCHVKGVRISGISKIYHTDIGHVCDTLGGSSGAPVFNEKHQVIGLHHHGNDSDDPDRRNRAVSINLVLGHIKKCRKKIYDQFELKTDDFKGISEVPCSAELS